ncbi:MAG: hypothetical protein GY746_05425 [Gammaproteobacteria bacterium]|nr:hypothetical protein [Gammaproteobacteria bacterium]
MSIVTPLVFLILLAGGCLASWQAALHWHKSNRKAYKEDPRDQEIRELSAALSIARKEVTKLGNTNGSQNSKINELQVKLQKTGDTLSDKQQKYNATKESLNKEIEEKNNHLEEIIQLRRELEMANGKLAELEVQAHMDTPGSGFVAGLDDMLDDDEKEVFTIRQEHKAMKDHVQVLTQKAEEQQTETKRWKQHCGVMSKTNKALKGRLEVLGGAQQTINDLETKVAELGKVQEDLSRTQELNKTRQTELKVSAQEIENLQNKNEQLKTQTTQLKQQLVSTEQLQRNAEQQLTQQQIESKKLKLQLVSFRSTAEKVKELQSKISDFKDHRKDNERLRSQMKEFEGLQLQAMKFEWQKARNEELYFQINKLEQQQKENEAVQAQLEETKHTNNKGVGSNTYSIPVLKSDESARENSHDDLKLIKGVGAKLEQKLNMLGIVNFRDLMELTSQDYERAYELIPSLKKRITNDAWVEQARNLHQEKYNETI